MNNEKGFSLIVLVITIIVILILTMITLDSSSEVIDDAVESKKSADATIDDDKIEEILVYELAGTYELIDIEIELKRIALSDTLKVKYGRDEYGFGYVLYIAEEDIEKVEDKTGEIGLKSYKDLTKSYIVNSSGEFFRLEEEWEFKD